jgi:shikimate 5-dehydrogenase
MTQAFTPLLQAAQARDCPVQRGTDMLFEMIPAYLRFFNLPVATRNSCANWRKFATESLAARLI